MKKCIAAGIIIGLLMLIWVGNIHATPQGTLVWTGASSTSWNNADNWQYQDQTPGIVPTADWIVEIPSGITRYPSSYMGDPICADLIIDTGAYMTLTNGWDLTIAYERLKNHGTLTVNSNQSYIYCYGNWGNDGVFNHGNSRVYFKTESGSSIEISGATTFHDIYIDSMKYYETVTISDHITATNIIVLQGTLCLLQSENITVTVTGDFKLNGPNDGSLACLVMGNNNKLYCDRLFLQPGTENITGGEIHITSGKETVFTCSGAGSNFTPSGGAVYFEGGDVVNYKNLTNTAFYNLFISNNTTLMPESASCKPLEITGSLQINSGSTLAMGKFLSPPCDCISIQGNFTNNGAFIPGDSGQGIITFTGTAASQITGSEPLNLSNLNIQKQGQTYVEIISKAIVENKVTVQSGGLRLWNSGLAVTNGPLQVTGKLEIEPLSILKLGNGVHALIEPNGIFSATGTSKTVPIKITGIQETDRYSFVVSGTINAYYYWFDQLDASGLVLDNNAVIQNLANGKFTNPPAGGTLITYNTRGSGAIAQASGIEFTSSITTGRYNVTALDQNTSPITFIYPTGNLSGANYEQDTYNLINWVLDNIQPEVWIEYPINHAQPEGKTIPIIIKATDDVMVSTVSLFANGQEIGTLSAPPYQFSYTIPAGMAGQNLELTATAVDHVGNIGTFYMEIPIVNLTGNVFAFEITGIPSPIIAGTPLTVTVKAIDMIGATVTDFNGSVYFLSSDGQSAINWSEAEFTPDDQGIKTISLPPLITAGNHFVEVFWIDNWAVNGVQIGIDVLPATPTITIEHSWLINAGQTTEPFMIYIADIYNNPFLGVRAEVDVTQIWDGGSDNQHFTLISDNQGIAYTAPITVSDTTKSIEVRASLPDYPDTPISVKTFYVKPKILINISLSNRIVQAGSPVSLMLTAFNLDGSIAVTFTGIVYIYAPYFETPFIVEFTAEDHGIKNLPDFIICQTIGEYSFFASTLPPAIFDYSTMPWQAYLGQSNELYILPGAPNRFSYGTISLRSAHYYGGQFAYCQAGVVDIFDNPVLNVIVQFDFTFTGNQVFNDTKNSPTDIMGRVGTHSDCYPYRVDHSILTYSVQISVPGSEVEPIIRSAIVNWQSMDGYFLAETTPNAVLKNTGQPIPISDIHMKLLGSFNEPVAHVIAEYPHAYIYGYFVIGSNYPFVSVGNISLTGNLTYYYYDNHGNYVEAGTQVTFDYAGLGGGETADWIFWRTSDFQYPSYAPTIRIKNMDIDVNVTGLQMIVPNPLPPSISELIVSCQNDYSGYSLNPVVAMFNQSYFVPDDYNAGEWYTHSPKFVLLQDGDEIDDAFLNSAVFNFWVYTISNPPAITLKSKKKDGSELLINTSITQYQLAPYIYSPKNCVAVNHLPGACSSGIIPILAEAGGTIEILSDGITSTINVEGIDIYIHNSEDDTYIKPENAVVYEMPPKFEFRCSDMADFGDFMIYLDDGDDTTSIDRFLNPTFRTIKYSEHPSEFRIEGKSIFWSPSIPETESWAAKLFRYGQNRIKITAGAYYENEFVGKTCNSARFEIQEFDLMVDSVHEDKEETQGALVLLNDNDDNNNGIPDLQENPVISESGLATMHINYSLQGSMPVTGLLKLEAPDGSAKIAVWDSITKNNRVNLPIIWTIGTDTIPHQLYLEGIVTSTTMRDITLVLSYSNNGQTVISDTVKVTVVKLDIVADTDRNNVIDANDELGKDIYTTGTNGKGAIVLVNSDDSDGDGLPDNWKGGQWFGITVTADTVVNADPDKDDLAKLVLHKLGFDTLPDDLKIVLRIDKPKDRAGNPLTEPVYFNNIDAKDRIRIFLPTRIDGDNLVITANDTAIIGPERGVQVEFVKNPTGEQQDISIFQGNGEVVMGVEGLEYGALVDIYVDIYLGEAKVAGSGDKVRMKCAPLILISHAQPAEESYVCRMGPPQYPVGHLRWNGKFVGDFNLSAETAGIITRTVIAPPDNNGDRWIRDEMKIGYTEAPYSKMYVILDSERDALDYPPGLTNYPPSLIKKGIGWIQIRTPNRTATTRDSFGNLEVSPPLTDVNSKNYPFGRIYYGIGPVGVDMDPLVIDFLKAQEVQDPIGFDTNWLSVGHVDEFLSFIPSGSGFKLAIASPNEAITRLNTASDIYLPVYEATPKFGAAYRTTKTLLVTVQAYNETQDAIIFGNPHGTGGLLLAIKNAFGSGPGHTLDIVEIPVLFYNSGGRALALTPDLVNWSVYGNHLIVPKQFLCRVNEDLDNDGNMDADEDTDNNGLLDAGEDTDGDNRLDFKEDINLDGILQRATPITPAPGTTIEVVPEEDANNDFILDQGEDLNSDGLLDTYRDIFEQFLQGVFPDKTLHFIDDWWAYHDWDGENHCGTNEKRVIPADKWWEK